MLVIVRPLLQYTVYSYDDDGDMMMMMMMMMPVINKEYKMGKRRFDVDYFWNKFISISPSSSSLIPVVRSSCCIIGNSVV